MKRISSVRDNSLHYSFRKTLGRLQSCQPGSNPRFAAVSASRRKIADASQRTGKEKWDSSQVRQLHGERYTVPVVPWHSATYAAKIVLPLSCYPRRLFNSTTGFEFCKEKPSSRLESLKCFKNRKRKDAGWELTAAGR